MTVNSVKKAWAKADELFPGDYQRDAQASERAGYPIYMSVIQGSNDHISDLGTCLEVNIGAESINIHINEDPEIAELNEEIEKLKAALEAEEEWKPAKNVGTNMKQEDYLHLENSGDVMTDEKAVEWIAEEFGFKPDMVKIRREVQTYEVNRHHRSRKSAVYERKPLYCATDWNYVRFDIIGNLCWQYEAINGYLYPYEN
ncbi:MAG: hypothetical protein IKN12_00760 [Selenomonadaceae bacterium]|nr:hypothetical protein [Selenomonadaceae bacterium]